MFFAPALEHVAGGFIEHARHHAVAHLNDRQLDAGLGQRLENNRADEAGADQHDRCAFLRELGDVARICQRPAGMNAGLVKAIDRRPDRAGTGCDQQFVVGDRRTVLERDGFCGGIDRGGRPLDNLYGVVVVVVLGLAQIGAVFADLAFQKIRNGHARVWWFAFTANKRDLRVRILLADRFGGGDTGRAGTEDDVMHAQPFE